MASNSIRVGSVLKDKRDIEALVNSCAGSGAQFLEGAAEGAGIV